MTFDQSKLYNCPDCKSTKLQHTFRDRGYWTFKYDRGLKVPAKFVTTGKVLSRRCPDCGYKSEVDTV